ncbi:hypothetical protein [Alistipes intestinihominis]|uniref:Uncharacterized protein n=1 Tax=Alistipes intestinihominis TaxID=3133172 RepID=A0ABV1GXJ2_9BACT
MSRRPLPSKSVIPAGPEQTTYSPLNTALFSPSVPGSLRKLSSRAS